MINERIAKLAAQALDEIGAGRWPPASTEIQGEDASSLLLTVNADVPKEVFTDTIRRRVALELNGIIPETTKNHLGTWIVVFKHGGKVYESLLPNGL